MKPAAALLAAGASRRLGRPKALVELGGETLLRRLTRELSAVATPLFVVIPPADPAIGAELAGTGGVPLSDPSTAGGLGASLALAASEVARRAPRAGALLVALVDQPLADRRLFARLVEAAAVSGWAACDYGDTIGPPAIFPRAAWNELAALAGDRGARDLLERERSRLALVEFPGGRYDVDTPEDLARLTKLGGFTGDGS